MSAPDNTKGLAETIIAGVVVVLGVACLIAGCAVGVGVGREQMQREAIEHGYAEYDSVSGKWMWKETK